MKIIKVKDQYYNLNHYQQFSINDGIFMLSSSLSGSLSNSNNRIFDDNNYIDLDSELIFRIIHSTNQMAFMNHFDQFLNGTSNLMDYSSLIEIHTGDYAMAHSMEEEILEIDQQTLKGAKIVIEEQNVSASLIQRRLACGYNESGRMVEQLEELGIIGPFAGSAVREVNFSSYGDLLNYLNAKGIKIVD